MHAHVLTPRAAPPALAPPYPVRARRWKLHKTVAEGLVALATELKNQLAAVKGVAVGIAPTFAPSLWPVARRLEGSTLALAAQDCHWEDRGAFTEVSPSLLADAGCGWVIVGHSERRQYFGETSATVGKKAAAVLAAGLGVIACVGETDAERDAGRTFAVVDEQLAGALAALPAGLDPSRLVIAYEPVWAIGTGRTATPAQAQEVHAHLRAELASRLGAEVAQQIRLQYGGSVKPSNAEALLGQADIDGALVGGASLVAADFVAIVRAARPS
ncbi:MAG: triose-phosphate isomerase [Kofleriaceae bacterium]